jgi:hypothetical protein
VAILDVYHDFNTGATELKHYLDHPEAGRGIAWYRNTFPLREEKVKKDPDVLRPPEAIGIQLVEKLCPFWIMIFSCAYFIATLIFGISWWIVKNDIQGAFGAAGFFASFLVIVALGITAAVSFPE